MYRGTTPSIVFQLPFTDELIDEIYITFRQGNRNQIEKNRTNIVYEGTTATVTLTQEETLSLDAKESILMQIRIKNSDGSVIASNIMETTIKEILKGGVI